VSESTSQKEHSTPSRACPTLEGLVERAATDEPQSWVSVLGLDRHQTGRTSEAPRRAAVGGRCLDRLLVSRQQLHAAGFDQQVDDEVRAWCWKRHAAGRAERHTRVGLLRRVARPSVQGLPSSSSS
jgi:hypothetical protein